MSKNLDISNGMYKRKPWVTPSQVWYFIKWMFVIFVPVSLLCWGVYSCNERAVYEEKYDNILKSYADSINHIYPSTKILRYEIVKPITSDAHAYHIWVKDENNKVFNIYIDKTITHIHIDKNTKQNVCVVTLRKYKGRLVKYFVYQQADETDGNGHIVSHYWPRKTNEIGIRDDKPVEIGSDVFDGEQIWYSIQCNRLKQYYYDETEGFPKKRYIKYMAKNFDLNINEV